MAPDDGMLAQMLVHAIGMIHIAGRAIVVEGVESQERLLALGSILPPIDYVQGYHISRPLEIDRLGAFLAARDLRPVDLAA
jgi:EAL domain-containing protein (putative c-di-GMP-specific phosphodiesterase class I)